MSVIHCPTCQTRIDTRERCTAARGMGRCFELQGHDGWHWTQVSEGSIVRWTGFYGVTACPGRLSLERWCVKTPGHDGLHSDGRGTSWDEVEDEDLP